MDFRNENYIPPTSESKSEAIVRRNTDVLFSTFADETTILMHLDSGTYYELDTIASHLWSKLERPISISTLGEEMILFYKGSPANILADVHDFLDYLIRERLVDVIA